MGLSSVRRDLVRSRLGRTVNFHFSHNEAQIVGAFSQKVDTNRPLQFQKRGQQFIGAHNETLSIIAMCVSNPDCAPREKSTADMQPQLHLALLSLSAMICPRLHWTTSNFITG